jgi:hypothetical protein
MPESKLTFSPALACSSVNKLDGQSHSASFIGARRAYFHVDYVANNAVYGIFTYLASLTLH